MKSRLLTLAASLIATQLMAGSNVTPAQAADPSPAVAPAHAHTPIQGIWVWKKLYVENQAEQDRMLAFLSQRGFNRIYMQIPWVADSVKAGKPTIDLQPQLASLIAKAAKLNIKVEALDGAPEMARKSHWSTTLAQLDAVLAFNKTLPADARFVGMHWDIEPYTRKNWKTPERPTIMLEYLQFLTQAKQKLAAEAPHMTLAVDIPMWYDNKTTPGDNCVLEYNGVTKNFHQHIQDITDYVGIMSYRQFALGNNSATYHVQNELAYAEQIHKTVCPAFETIRLNDTPEITFFGQGADKFLAEKEKLTTALKDRPGYGGLLVHQYPSVRDLLEGPTQPQAQR